MNQARKVCLLGSFGVGKTSLVQRFVRNTFSDKYLSTVGVKVDTKLVGLDSGDQIKLVIWDIAGAEDADMVPVNYLKGMGGYLMVADGTRAPTLRSAVTYRKRIEELFGELPFVGLLNKHDLREHWEITRDVYAELGLDPGDWLHTSACDGENVEQAFLRLARDLLK